MRLFIEDLKGYMDVYNSVKRIAIKKVNNKNALVITFATAKDDEVVPLNEIRLAFMIDANTLHECFRYEK